jgi:LysM repeat protein
MAQVVKIDPYNSQTGAGTLSGYASQYGVSVDQLLQANQGNPSVKSADLISAGGHLIIPDARSVQQTDTQYRATTNENLNTLNTKVATIANANQGQTGSGGVDANGNIIGANGQVVGKADPKDMPGYKPPTKEDLEASKMDDPYGVKGEIKRMKEEAQVKINDINSTLDSIATMSNQANANLISSIKTIYGSRIAKMEDANKRLYATKETVGMRQGRARYAPKLQAGILTDEEISGHERIAALEGAMLQAIAGAQQAQADGDMKIFNSRMDEINKIEKELTDKIMNQHKMAVDYENNLRAKEREERLVQKEDFDKMLDLSARSAPAVYSALAGFKSEAEQKAFLEQYSKKTGIDIDVLMGDIEKYSSTSEKEALNMENIRSQIDRRNQLNEEDDADSEYRSVSTENILSGASSLSDLSGSEKEKVKADMRELGFYSTNPPQWFIEMLQDQKRQTVSPTVVRTEWEKYRQGFIGE